MLYDKQEKCGVWLIDFSKTMPVPTDTEINHRFPWQLGNHEDGLLFGIDNIITVSFLNISKYCVHIQDIVEDA